LKSQRLRVAIVGLGKMGLVHAGILNVIPDVKIVAVCEKNKFIRRFSKKILAEVEIFSDFEKMAALNLDAIYVTTPIPTHFAIVNTLFEERIAPNIFVEKTLAQNYKGAKILSELAEEQKSVTMVGYLRRFYVTFQKARELLLNEALGKVNFFKAYAYSSDFLEKEQIEISNSRGGVLRDLGCHAIDLALWFFDDLEVSSVKPYINRGSGDSIFFRLNNSRINGELDVSWCKEKYRLPEVGFLIRGSKGQIEVNDDRVKLIGKKGKTSIWYRHNLSDNVPFWLGLPEYYREDLSFINSIIEESKAQPDFTEASKVDRIISQVEDKAGGVY
jgi:predicted dehydrogenase